VEPERSGLQGGVIFFAVRWGPTPSATALSLRSQALYLCLFAIFAALREVSVIFFAVRWGPTPNATALNTLATLGVSRCHLFLFCPPSP
jgi:hypothetical protein